MKYIVRFEDGSYLGSIEGSGMFFAETADQAWRRPSQIVAAQDALALQPFSGFTIERVDEREACQKTAAPHRYFGFSHESRCLDCEALESAEFGA
jgi:hypothetical protein